MLTKKQLETLSDDEREYYENLTDPEEIASYEYFYGFATGAVDQKPITNKEIELYQQTTDNISLKAVCQLLDFIPHRGQQGLVYDFDSHNLVHNSYVFAAGRRVGKAVRTNTPIKTPHGDVILDDLRAGDELYGADGKVQTVLQVHPTIKEQLIEVTVGDYKVIAHPDHEWTVKDHHGKMRTLETRYLQKYYKRTRKNSHYIEDPAKRTTKKQGLKETTELKFKVMNHMPLELPTKDLWDPYVLGALLGDGSLVTSCSFGCGDLEITERVARTCGLPVRVGRENYWVTGVGVEGTKEIKRLGLHGTRSHTKFIPEEYFQGSVHQRMELLRGLLDTDGYVAEGKRVSKIEYSTTSPMLRDGVQRLVKSLGGNYQTYVKKEPTYTYKGEKRIGKESYRVYMQLPKEAGNPFFVRRKADKYSPPRDPLFNYISGMRQCEEYEECKCISVSNEDGLYIANNVVTHNSSILGIISIRELLVPFSSTVLVAPVFNNAKIIFNEVIKLVQRLNLPIKSMNKGQFNFELENGARFTANSAANIEAALGGKFSMILLEEFQSIQNADEIYKQMLAPTQLDYGTRPSGILYGRVFAIGTSRGTENQLYDYYLKEQKFSNWKSFTSPSMTNPTLPASYFEQMRLELGDMLYRQEILAEFIGQDANVFHSFDKDINLYDPATTVFNSESLIISGIDIGWSDSTANLWLYREPSGYYVHAAYSENTRATSEHITSYREIENGLEGKIDMRYGDPAAAQTLNDYIITYNYEVAKADNSVADSIRYINQLFSPTGVNSKPRLFINQELEELIRQISRVQYRQGQSKSSKDPFIKDAEGTHWDLIAALRYALYSDKFNMSAVNILVG